MYFHLSSTCLNIPTLSLLWIIIISESHSEPVRNISIALTPVGASVTCPQGCALNIKYCITEDSRRCTLVPERDLKWHTLGNSESIVLFYSYEPDKKKPILKIDVLLDSQVISSFITDLSTLSKKESSLEPKESKNYDIHFQPDITASCTSGYYGNSCETRCLTAPDKRFSCNGDGSKICANGYWYYAEVDDCYPQETYKLKCENGGKPKKGYPTFTCECPPNFTGDSCSQPDVCYKNLCQRQAKCIRPGNVNLPYICECPPNYLPPFCEHFNPCSLVDRCTKPQECYIKNVDGVPQADCRCPNNTPTNCLEYRVLQPPSVMTDASSSGSESSVSTVKISPVLIGMIAVFSFIVLAVVIVVIAIQKTPKQKPHFRHIQQGDVLMQHRCSVSPPTFDGYQGAHEVAYGEDDECILSCPIRSSHSSLSRRPLNNMCQAYCSMPTSMMHISYPNEPSSHFIDPVQTSVPLRPPSLPRGGGYMSTPLQIDGAFSRSGIPGNSSLPMMVAMGTSGLQCSPEKIYSPLVRVMEQEETDSRMVTSSMSPAHETSGLVVSPNNFCQSTYLATPISMDTSHTDPESNNLLAIDV